MNENKKKWFIVGLFLFIFAVITAGQGKIIKYEILRKWTPGRDGTGMEILVSPTNTKEEVLTLAKYLRDQYVKSGFVTIHIFDLKEAWENRYNDNYSQVKYFKHYLVAIWVPKMNKEEITWMAERREEPKKK